MYKTNSISVIVKRFFVLLLCAGLVLGHTSCFSSRRAHVEKLQQEKDAQKEEQAKAKEQSEQEEVKRRYERQSKKTKALMKANQKKAEDFNNRYKKKCFIMRWFSGDK